jgi:hypothetical protein
MPKGQILMAAEQAARGVGYLGVRWLGMDLSGSKRMASIPGWREAKRDLPSLTNELSRYILSQRVLCHAEYLQS